MEVWNNPYSFALCSFVLYSSLANSGIGGRIMQVRLIVPCRYDNADGKRFELEPIKLYGPDCARIAGGFTAYPATGGWIDPHNNRPCIEPVIVFDLDLCEDNRTNKIGQLFDLARQVCRDLHQNCVYLRIDGEVHYVKA